MATPALPTHPGPEHLVTVKVLYNDSNRRFKLPLRDLKAQVFPQKVRESPPELPTGSRARPQSLIMIIDSAISVILFPFGPSDKLNQVDSLLYLFLLTDGCLRFSFARSLTFRRMSTSFSNVIPIAPALISTLTATTLPSISNSSELPKPNPSFASKPARSTPQPRPPTPPFRWSRPTRCPLRELAISIPF